MKPLTINLKQSWIPLKTASVKGISRIASTFFFKKKKRPFYIQHRYSQKLQLSVCKVDCFLILTEISFIGKNQNLYNPSDLCRKP